MDARKRALGAAGECGRGKRLAALPRVKTNCKRTRQRSPGKEEPVPAVGEANRIEPRSASGFHFAVLDGRRHSPATPQTPIVPPRHCPYGFLSSVPTSMPASMNWPPAVLWQWMASKLSPATMALDSASASAVK